MLSLRGIPAVYFPSLLGISNDHEGVARTGRPRTINRRKFAVAELQQLISGGAPHRPIWNAYRRLLALRREQPAFHPDAEQEVLPIASPEVIAFRRTSLASGQTILVATNLSDRVQQIDLQHYCLMITGNELISGAAAGRATSLVSLEPYQVLWLPVKFNTHVLTEAEVLPWQTSFKMG